MRDWCQYCGAKFDPDELVAVMAGLRYHPACAEADADYMERAAAHFAQHRVSIEAPADNPKGQGGSAT